MNKFILIISILLTVLFTNAQIVNIPDSNFKSILVSNPDINLNGNNEIELVEAHQYAGIFFVPNSNISDLTGIEAFTALNRLYCRGNNLMSIDVSSNTELTHLFCGSNQLESLDVSNNTALRILNCSFNQITALDISFNVGLTDLECYSNELSALDISHNINLIKLHCTFNQISEINTNSNSDLSLINCGNNKITSLDVSENVNLIRLGCGFNKISNLDLSNNSSLKELTCGNNILESLNIQNGNNKNMEWLSTNGNPNLDCILIDTIKWRNSDTINYDIENIDSWTTVSINCELYPQFYITDFKASPNPSSRFFTISITGLIESDEIDIHIYNILGQKQNPNIKENYNEILIDGENLADGVYIVFIECELGIIGKVKLIKHK